MTQKSSTPSRNNPVINTRIESPLQKYLTVKGKGKIDVYFPHTKKAGEQMTQIEPSITLAIKFFLYGYDNKKKVSFKSTEYSLRSDEVKIYKRVTGEAQSKEYSKGKVDSETIKNLREIERLTVGCNVYVLEIGTGELTRIEMPGSSRSLFMEFQETTNNKFPEFTMTFRAVTMDDLKAAREQAGASVILPEFLPVFEVAAVTEDDLKNATAACEIIDNYFAAVSGVEIPVEKEATETNGEETENKTVEALDQMPTTDGEKAAAVAGDDLPF